MSTKNKGYLVPDLIEPAHEVGFCVPVPNDPAYLRAFWGQMSELGRWGMWEKEASHKATLAAARWRDSYDRISECTGEPCEDCPDECMGDCGVTFLPTDPHIDYAPNDPFRTPDHVPSGYLLPPWHLDDGRPAANLSSLPVGFFNPLLFLSGFPRFRVHCKGNGTAQLYLRKALFGGYAYITVDGNAFGTFVDMSSFGIDDYEGLLSILAPVVGAITGSLWALDIIEVQLEGSGDHYIDVTCLPKLAISLLVVQGFGMQLEKVKICTDEPQEVLEEVPPQMRLEGCILQWRPNSDADWVDLGNVCGEDGQDGQDGQDGVCPDPCNEAPSCSNIIAMNSSASAAGYPAYLAFDPVVSEANRWLAATSGSGNFISWEYETATALESIKVHAYAGGEPDSFTVEGFNGSAWVLLAFSDEGDFPRQVDIADVGAFTKWRITETSFGQPSITWLEIHCKEAEALTCATIINMNSSAAAEGYPVELAFDPVISEANRWLAATSGSGKSIGWEYQAATALAWIRVHTYAGGEPEEFAIQAFNGSEWVVLASSDEGDFPRQVAIADVGAFTQWRIVVSSFGQPSITWLEFQCKEAEALACSTINAMSSSGAAAGYPPYYAFDPVISEANRWLAAAAASGNFIQWEYEDATALDWIRVHAYPGSEPDLFVIQAFDGEDGIYMASSEAGDFPRQVAITPMGAYTRWRILFSSYGQPSITWLEIQCKEPAVCQGTWDFEVAPDGSYTITVGERDTANGNPNGHIKAAVAGIDVQAVPTIEFDTSGCGEISSVTFDWKATSALEGNPNRNPNYKIRGWNGAGWTTLRDSTETVTTENVWYHRTLSFTPGTYEKIELSVLCGWGDLSQAGVVHVDNVEIE